MMTSGITAFRSTGSTIWTPFCLSYLARAYAELGQFDDAWRCLGEAMTVVEITKEKWSEAESNRLAGEIALMSPERDAARAEAYFERSLASRTSAASQVLGTARRDEHGAAVARSGKAQKQARELLAPVYGWFTEGFDTLDLKEAKALLDDLANLKKPELLRRLFRSASKAQKTGTVKHLHFLAPTLL